MTGRVGVGRAQRVAGDGYVVTLCPAPYRIIPARSWATAWAAKDTCFKDRYAEGSDLESRASQLRSAGPYCGRSWSCRRPASPFRPSAAEFRMALEFG